MQYFTFSSKRLSIIIGLIAVALIVAGMGLFPNVAHAEQRTPNNDSYWANHIITEVIQANSASDIMKIADEYWSDWHDEWLNKYAMYAFGIKAHEMWNSLSIDQKHAVEAVIKDGSTDDTFYINTTCGTKKGDSCSEDYISMVMTAAMAKNLYPQVAQQIGVGKLNSIEQNYITKTFSTQNGWYGLVSEKSDWDSKMEVKMYNHNEENPVYAGILIMGMNNARYTYILSGNSLPSYYRNANITPLFNWIQEKAYSDGHAYLETACHTTSGNEVSCNDRNVANAVPGIIPAGRYMKSVFGSSAFTPGFYTFITWNTSGAGGNFNAARSYFYNTWNPLTVSRVVRRAVRRLSPAAFRAHLTTRQHQNVVTTTNTTRTSTKRVAPKRAMITPFQLHQGPSSNTKPIEKQDVGLSVKPTATRVYTVHYPWK